MQKWMQQLNGSQMMSEIIMIDPTMFLFMNSTFCIE